MLRMLRRMWMPTFCDCFEENKQRILRYFKRTCCWTCWFRFTNILSGANTQYTKKKRQTSATLPDLQSQRQQRTFIDTSRHAQYTDRDCKKSSYREETPAEFKNMQVKTKTSWRVQLEQNSCEPIGKPVYKTGINNWYEIFLYCAGIFKSTCLLSQWLLGCAYGTKPRLVASLFPMSVEENKCAARCQ